MLSRLHLSYIHACTIFEKIRKNLFEPLAISDDFLPTGEERIRNPSLRTWSADTWTGAGDRRSMNKMEQQHTPSSSAQLGEEGLLCALR